MPTLTKRYKALTDAELEHINLNTWTKKFKKRWTTKLR